MPRHAGDARALGGHTCYPFDPLPPEVILSPQRCLCLLGLGVGLASCRARDTATPAAAGDPRVALRPNRPSLVGTWRVVRFCDDDSTGRLYDPYGPHPDGVFVYSAGGQLSIQIASTPPPSHFTRGDFNPSDRERQALFDGYMGYFGTYSITSDSTVIHHVSGGTLPSFIGTDQPRLYQVRGDTLTLGGSRLTWPCRVLLRSD